MKRYFQALLLAVAGVFSSFSTIPGSVIVWHDKNTLDLGNGTGMFINVCGETDMPIEDGFLSYETYGVATEKTVNMTARFSLHARVIDPTTGQQLVVMSETTRKSSGSFFGGQYNERAIQRVLLTGANGLVVQGRYTYIFTVNANGEVVIDEVKFFYEGC